MGIRQVGLCDLVLVPKMNLLSLCHQPSVKQTVYHSPDPNVSASDFFVSKKFLALKVALPDLDAI